MNGCQVGASVAFLCVRCSGSGIRGGFDPDRIYSSDVRWWLGSASATDETLEEEIQELYDDGFRGVELCMQNDGCLLYTSPSPRDRG